ncbi:MAG: DNA mismatch repair endonuclease MutL [Alphaproteobacteria bacterium]|nr:DNA mismatch repair endonuclease MutL [Alphaproteobacteria bacterium]
MAVRVLPDFLINQIAAGEVVERPASVVKELVENALDAGADQIVVDIADGGRTLISVIDNGGGMSADDLRIAITRHATSKLPDDDLLNINFMGFRGEALPSIASVADMTIDTFRAGGENGWQIDATTGDVRPSSWDAGTRVRVRNLFGKTPARLKFLRADRAEMAGVLEVVKRLAMARPDVGFVLNDKWCFPKDQDLEERIAAVMGDDVRGNMLRVDATSASDASMRLSGFVSRPTLRRASSVDQYLFVNGRPVKDKVLVGALRAAYMDVMHAREFPLCALYLTLDPRNVDVNVSPAKTEVHFLEPAHVRAFIIKSLRTVLAQTMSEAASVIRPAAPAFSAPVQQNLSPRTDFHLTPISTVAARPAMRVCSPDVRVENFGPFVSGATAKTTAHVASAAPRLDNVTPGPGADIFEDMPLGRAIGQFGNKYIIAARGDDFIIVDQHAAHERITYERLRMHSVKVQPLLTPIVVSLRPEDVDAVTSIAAELAACGLAIDAFGEDAVAISAKPADWDLNWADALRAIADEVRANGASAQLHERLHLKLANFACHHSVRAGQRLDMDSMNALLRDIERTQRAGQCNHGRPVYKIIPMHEIDGWFERA